MKGLKPAQVRMARGALRWSLTELAERAGVDRNLLAEFEAEELSVAERLTGVRTTLEEAGVEFIDENGGGPGVRLRKRPAEERRERVRGYVRADQLSSDPPD
jgi:transcriptional regulator with XRE-family HTH domain